MDLGEAIKRDHDLYRRFFAKMAKSRPEDGVMRQVALEGLMVSLNAHHEAEELTIFPAMMKVADLRGLAFELEVEHGDMRRLFDSIKASRADTEVWKYRLSSVYDIMHAHWLKEEEQLIPFWMDYFSESDLALFGRRFDEILAKQGNQELSRKA